MNKSKKILAEFLRKSDDDNDINGSTGTVLDVALKSGPVDMNRAKGMPKKAASPSVDTLPSVDEGNMQEYLNKYHPDSKYIDSTKPIKPIKTKSHVPKHQGPGFKEQIGDNIKGKIDNVKDYFSTVPGKHEAPSPKHQSPGMSTPSFSRGKHEAPTESNHVKKFVDYLKNLMPKQQPPNDSTAILPERMTEFHNSYDNGKMNDYLNKYHPNRTVPNSSTPNAGVRTKPSSKKSPSISQPKPNSPAERTIPNAASPLPSPVTPIKNTRPISHNQAPSNGVTRPTSNTSYDDENVPTSSPFDKFMNDNDQAATESTPVAPTSKPTPAIPKPARQRKPTENPVAVTPQSTAPDRTPLKEFMNEDSPVSKTPEHEHIITQKEKDWNKQLEEQKHPGWQYDPNEHSMEPKSLPTYKEKSTPTVEPQSSSAPVVNPAPVSQQKPSTYEEYQAKQTQRQKNLNQQRAKEDAVAGGTPLEQFMNNDSEDKANTPPVSTSLPPPATAIPKTAPKREPSAVVPKPGKESKLTPAQQTKNDELRERMKRERGLPENSSEKSNVTTIPKSTYSTGTTPYVEKSKQVKIDQLGKQLSLIKHQLSTITDPKEKEKLEEEQRALYEDYLGVTPHLNDEQRNEHLGKIHMDENIRRAAQPPKPVVEPGAKKTNTLPKEPKIHKEQKPAHAPVADGTAAPRGRGRPRLSDDEKEERQMGMDAWNEDKAAKSKVQKPEPQPHEIPTEKEADKPYIEKSIVKPNKSDKSDKSVKKLKREDAEAAKAQRKKEYAEAEKRFDERRKKTPVAANQEIIEMVKIALEETQDYAQIITALNAIGYKTADVIRAFG